MAVTRPRSAPARSEQVATRIAFFIAGFGMAAWAPLVPFAKARIGMNDGVLGLLLLFLGIGSFVAMPLAGAFAAWVGCRRVVIVSVLAICLALPLLLLLLLLLPLLLLLLLLSAFAFAVCFCFCFCCLLLRLLLLLLLR